MSRKSMVRESIEEAFDASDLAFSRVEDLAYKRGYGDARVDEEQELATEMLDDAGRAIALHLLGACDFLGLVSLGAELREFLSRMAPASKLTMAPWLGELYSPSLFRLRQFYNAIAPHLGGSAPELDDYERLRRLLRATGTVVHDRGIEPSNEAEVRGAIRSVLKLVFPDLVSEVPIPKPIKTWKPDFGVPSLRTAIEYKFITSEDELKACVGGVYEDSRGYSGSRDWERFIAVLYLSAPFFTDDQLREETKISKLPENWELMLVHGTGARKPRGRKRKNPADPADPSGVTSGQ